jgi:hypothetical protein
MTIRLLLWMALSSLAAHAVSAPRAPAVRVSPSSAFHAGLKPHRVVASSWCAPEGPCPCTELV